MVLYNCTHYTINTLRQPPQRALPDVQIPTTIYQTKRCNKARINIYGFKFRILTDDLYSNIRKHKTRHSKENDGTLVSAGNEHACVEGIFLQKAD